LAQRSSFPALSSRVQPSLALQQRKDDKKRAHVDRQTKERLKRLVGRSDQPGQGGLWSIKSEKQLQESQPGSGLARSVAQAAIQNLAEFDAWAVASTSNNLVRVQDGQQDDNDNDKDVSMEAVVALHNGTKPKPKVS
jgi:hypothetical protein